MEITERMNTQPIPRLIIGLSAPAIFSLLLNALNSAIDGMFVAKSVGTTALSAITISFGIILVIQAFSMLIAAGSSAAIALKLGKSDRYSAEKIIGNAFMFSLLLSFVVTLFGLLAIDPLLSLYGASPENIEYAKEYTTVIISGSFFFITAQAMNNCVKGIGYAKRAFVHSLSSVVVNTLLDAIFIFGCGWGVFGAALSTVIGNAVCMLLAIQFLCSKTCMANLKKHNIYPDKETIKHVLSIGLPACVMQFALSLVSLTFNHVAAFYGGHVAVAAYGIMYNITMMVYMPIIGLGQGIQPILGYNYGAENYVRVKRTLKCSITYATGFALFMFALIEGFSGAIVDAFGGSSDPALAAMAVPGMRLFYLMVPLVGVQMIGANYFQYIGKIKQSVILSALRQLVLLIPFALCFPSLFGIKGIWLATPAADFLAFTVTAIFIRQELSIINSQIPLKLPINPAIPTKK